MSLVTLRIDGRRLFCTSVYPSVSSNTNDIPVCMVTENVADLRNLKNVFYQKRKERGKVYF